MGKPNTSVEKPVCNPENAKVARCMFQRLHSMNIAGTYKEKTLHAFKWGYYRICEEPEHIKDLDDLRKTK